MKWKGVDKYRKANKWTSDLARVVWWNQSTPHLRFPCVPRQSYQPSAGPEGNLAAQGGSVTVSGGVPTATPGHR